ncbi:MAG: DUF2020 domain-containing protein [Pseudonocardiaceae bacterium]
MLQHFGAMSPSCHIARIVTTVCGVLLLGWTGGCGGAGSTPAESAASIDPAEVTVPGAASLPTPAPEPQPTGDGLCPYLDLATVETINGQRVSSVRVSADQPHPACFFYRGDGREQLRTWIVVSTPAGAGATVDAVAPVATSDRAELPGGWSGGAQPTSDGAVIAVARQGTAVVVTTNQHQTIGARRIAEQVIAALDLE